MKWALIFLITFAGIVRADDVKVALNGSELVFDADTGGLLRLSYPDVGNLVEASRER